MLFWAALFLFSHVCALFCCYFGFCWWWFYFAKRFLVNLKFIRMQFKTECGLSSNIYKKMLYVFFFVYLHLRYCSHGQLGSGAKLKTTTCFKNERYGRVCGCSMCVSLCVFARFVIMYITLVQVTVHQRIFDRVEYRKACHILLAIAYGNTIFNKPSNIIYIFFSFYVHTCTDICISGHDSDHRLEFESMLLFDCGWKSDIDIHTYYTYIHVNAFEEHMVHSTHFMQRTLWYYKYILYFCLCDLILYLRHCRLGILCVCLFFGFRFLSFFLILSPISLSLVRSLYLSLCVLFTVYSNQIHVTVLLSLRLPLKQYCFHWIN